MVERICVVTACTNERDIILHDQVAIGARFIAYVDRVDRCENGQLWEPRPACTNFVSPRRNSRIHKILIHQYIDTEYSLWMDANIRLLVPVERLVEEWLAHHDMAIFKHRVRNCLYDEATICADLRLDDPDLIREQAAHYLRMGFPAGQGLAEACVILRRHTKTVETFNNAWWSEYSRYSVRDQIGLMYAARQSAVSLNLVTPVRFEHPYFDCAPRPPGVEQPVKLPDNVLEIC